MSAISRFLQQVADDCDRIESDLKSFEQRVEAAGARADAWTKKGIEDLKAEYIRASDAANELVDIVERRGGDMVKAHEEARRRWNAFNAALASYRAHLDKAENS